MFDTLPFPNMTAKDAEERSKQTIDYLLQFREELVFILDNIVGGEYGRLTTQPAKVDAVVSNVSDATLTVAEVINSAAFKASLNGVEEKIPKEYLKSAEQTYVAEEPEGINLYVMTDSNGNAQVFKVKNGKTPNVAFSVNFETGNLEYTTS